MKASSCSFVISILLFLFTFFLLTPKDFAQTDTLNFQANAVRHYESQWAFLADVSKYADFTNTTDFSVGAKRLIGQSMYIMGEVTFIGLLNDLSNYSTISPNGSIPVAFNYGADQIKGTKINMLFIYYPIANKTLNFYVSCGPVFLAYKKNEKQYSYILNQSSVEHTYANINDDVWGAGLSAGIGVEWNIANPFSVIAEYGMIAISNHHSLNETTGNYETPLTGQSAVSRNLFEAHLSNLKFGVMVYL